jgi:hypothetical protein
MVLSSSNGAATSSIKQQLYCVLSPSAREEEDGKRKRKRASWAKLLGYTRLNKTRLCVEKVKASGLQKTDELDFVFVLFFY